ncbi:hypothetical protein K440DRAFT_404106 [Wilcoxina mikolae CBS 423.85]|nr:hypothetical protein K440DRAFT_404106 [Wilcoxina mikolae CBS 423.85]
MATSGSPGLQPGSHRNSLNPDQFPTSNGLYNQQGYPSNYDPRFEDIKTEQSHLLASQQGELNNSQQFNDYPLYSTAEDFIPTSAVINPADLSFSATSPHQGTSQLQIDPNHQNSQGHQQPGAEHYLSATTQPPATAPYEWDQVFQASQSWSNHRAPSECSGISSVVPSPYIGSEEYNEQPSPLVGAQHYPNQGSMQDLLNSGGDAFGLERFSLSDRGDPSPCPSTGFHSEANSPYLHAQDNHTHIPAIGLGGTGMHPMMPPPERHGAGQSAAGLGIGGEESFPRIDISFAPPQRQPTFPDKPGDLPDDQALSPPPKSMP